MNAFLRPSVDEWALGLCEKVAERSRDPSTKVGAVILRPDNTIVSVGYNGFPRGVKDLPERYADRQTKYAMTVHAEVNAIVTAGGKLDLCTIYVWPFHPCQVCAGVIIQSGITRVVTRPSDVERWAESFAVAKTMFDEAGVMVSLIEKRDDPPIC